MHRSARTRPAFTLIEVLVVVAIIALLVAILLPSLTKAREQATGAACKSNMHQLMLAMQTYVSEQKVLPGTNHVFWVAWEAAGKPGGGWPTWKASDSWLGVRDPETAFDRDRQQDLWNHLDATVPKQGSLYRLTRAERVYLCPKDKKGLPDPEDEKGGGGNGRYSYTMNGMLGLKAPEKTTSFRYVQNFEAKSGALPPPVATIPSGTVMKWSNSQMVVLIEEHPWNNVNHGWVGDSWAADTYLSLRHHASKSTGMANFSFLDGHVDARRYPYSVTVTEGKSSKTTKLQGVDLFNEFKFPYAYAGNGGGLENERAFVRSFPYPYTD